MKKMHKIASAVLAGALALSLSSCGGKDSSQGTVRYLNFKPEVTEIYQELAAAYEKETGGKSYHRNSGEQLVRVYAGCKNGYKRSADFVPD